MLGAAAALGLSAELAMAQETLMPTGVISQLAEQGFDNPAVDLTEEGYLRVTTESGNLEREFVFDPATGEVIQDRTVRLTTRSSMSPRSSHPLLRGVDREDSDRSDNFSDGGQSGSCNARS